jgi:hypothetical protein
MAKGARASTKKANNAKLKSRVFGPVEAARTERLSAKLLELVSQPKPKQEDALMDTEEGIEALPSRLYFQKANRYSESTETNKVIPVPGTKQNEGTKPNITLLLR